MLRKLASIVVGLVLVAAVCVGGFVLWEVTAFDAAAAKVWDVPLADVVAPDLSAAAAWVAEHGDAPVQPDAIPTPEGGDAQVASAVDVAPEDPARQQLAKDVATYRRGRHLGTSLGACVHCHGPDLASPEVVDLGPLGKIVPPNISTGGKLGEYADAELHRLLVHGLRRDGTSVLFMNAADFRWWPDSDLLALIGWLRTLPAVDKPSPDNEVGVLGKVLDRLDKLPMLSAERAAAKPREIAPEPTPTAAYGKSLVLLCRGCHGEGLSGGPIPGAPSSLPIPKNITPHATGIAHYGFEDFDRLLRTGKKPDGSDLDPFMPIGALKNLSDVEMRALWAYLSSVEPRPFGQR